MIRVPVGNPAEYQVLIGRDLLGELPAMLGEQVQRVLVIYPEPLRDKADAVFDILQNAGYQVHLFAVPDAEAQKTLEVAGKCWERLGLLEFTRTDAIVAVGGGATTDLGGFVAASWLRGIKVVHVATSVLGMVDAAVGGKTGINTAEGKNLVGAFYLPAGVICDVATLETLSQRDFIAGLAEVVKTGLISDPVILDLVDEHAAQLRDWPPTLLSFCGPLRLASTNAAPAPGAPNPLAPSDGGIWAVVEELIARSVMVKAKVVAEDLREAGPREFLNYGHTFGHAVELTEHFRLRHGEAVSIGMIFVAELARAAGFLEDDLVQLHYDLLTKLGLPTEYDGDADWEQLLTAMRRDKKTRGSKLRFVVLTDIAKPARLEGPDPEMVQAVYRRVSEASGEPVLPANRCPEN